MTTTRSVVRGRSVWSERARRSLRRPVAQVAVACLVAGLAAALPGTVTPAGAAPATVPPQAAAPAARPRSVEAAAVQEARRAGHRVEVVARRSETGTLWANPDGTLTHRISAVAQRWRDGRGRWHDIDLTARVAPDGLFAAASSGLGLRLPARADGAVLLPVGSQQVRLTHPQAGWVAGSASGTAVRYPAAVGGSALSEQFLVDGAEESLTLASAAGPASYTDEFTLPPGVSVRQARAGVEFIGAAGTVLARFGGGRAYDSARGRGGAEAPVSVRLTGQSPGRAMVSVGVDPAWLADRARVFPVTIDPVFYKNTSGTGGADTWVETDSSVSQWSSTELRLGRGFGSSGNEVARTLIRFDTSSAPANAHVTEGHLTINNFAYSSGTGCNTVYLTGLATGFSSSTVWTNQPGSDGQGVTTTSFSPCATGWKNLDLTGLANRWFSGAANNGFRLQNTESTSPNPGWLKFYSGETGGNSAPALYLTYTDKPTLYQPDTLHSNGADLSWSRYTGALSGQPFATYEVHRSLSPNFTPSPSTLLMSTTDISTTTYRDTTAAPGGTFYYKVLANSSASAEVQVTLPADGQATKFLQPDPAAGKDTKLFYQYFASGDIQCGTYGTEDWMRVGSDDASTTMWRSLIGFDLKDIPPGAPITSATMSLWKIASNAAATISAYRVSRDWVEGTYGCFNGATWYTAANGVNWTTNGGDYDPTVVASRSVAAGEAAGWHDFDIKSAAQAWVNGDKPNLGLLLRVADESRTVKNDINYTASDAVGSAIDIAHHPRLAVSYADGSHAIGPTVSIVSPAAGATVRGTTAVTAAASDDRRVEKVEFYRDGGTTPLATDTAAPWTFNWSTTSVANGTHTLTAKAYDDAGNSTTSATVSVQVANYSAPTTSITSPGNNASGLKGTVPVSTSNTVASGLSVSKVELYVDGALYDASTVAPYGFSWDTLDPALPAYDRSSHTLSTKVYDSSGQVVASPTVTVSTGNTTGTRYMADFATSAVPQAMTYTPGGPQLVYPVDVTITNKSTLGWSAATTFLRYRWYSPNPADPVIESGDLAGLGLAAGAASAPVRVNVTPPTLPDGADAAQYRLRFDVFDTTTSPATAFAGKGNNPSDNPVVINKALSTKLGIEKYYSYVTTPVGAGMTNVVNVANGNSLLTLTPLSNPGRGLHTVARLTYNSLEQKSESPVGTNFSLSISSLTRFGNPLDVHPNNADTIAGRSNKFITFVDGDGTLQRFDGVTGADGVTFWKEPPGVHLYLRSLTTDVADPRYWAATRPDRVTFYFNAAGYPTFVSDRNGNTISFTLSAVQPGDDPGGPKFHVTKVIDAAGQGASPAPNRSFDITYFTKATARKPQIRGKISRITDHLLHAVDFAYYDDGNLLSITEAGGANADGTALADRTWSFTYTDSSGSGPANNPSSQSSLIYSARDPLGHETLFAYNGPGTNQNRWKVASVTDRAGNTTTFGYDITNRVTTVAAPTPSGQTARTTKYGYDSDGKPVSITDPLNQVTALEWNTDFAVTKITEPNTKTRRFAYNDNGYLTDVYDQLDNHTVLTYQNLPADANDTSAHWRTGRTIPHLSQLASKQDPVDVAAGNGTKWTFDYDPAGNLTTLTEPVYPNSPARNTYNPDGTIATSADFKSNVTRFTSYDDNGQPTTIVDATDNATTPTHPTKMGFDDGGRLVWVQDPAHAAYSTSDTRARTSFYYDSFNRLGRQSTPKSTSRELGRLIWSDTFYDANDNVVRAIAPHYGAQDTGTGDTTTVSYDAMDRERLITGPDTSADPAGERTLLGYDVAGRVATVTLPLGLKKGTPNSIRTINNTYDALDRVIRQTRYHQKPDSTIQTLIQHSCYDTVGNLISTTAPKAALASVTCPATHTTPYTTVYRYDDAHRPISVSDPLNHITTFGYDANGNRTRVTDAANNATVLRYDSLNRLTRTDEPYLVGTSPRSVVTVHEYDENGNRTRLISPRGYDASPDKATFSSYVTTFSYDALNRLTRTGLPTDSGHPTAYYLHRGYDVNGNLTVTTLPDTHPNLADVPAAARTTVEYFDSGWIAASNDPANPKVHFDYNPLGQQTLRTPETSTGALDTGKQIRWSYLPDGQLRERTDQKGQTVSYTYNADNQLLTSHDASGLTTPAETAVDVVNAYDDLDRLTRSDSKKQTETTWRFSTSAYDANNNLTDTEQNATANSAGGPALTAGRKQHTDFDQADWITTQLDYGKTTAASDDQRITNTFSPTGQQTMREIEQNNGSGTWTPKQTTTWDYFANNLLKQLTTRNAGPGAGTLVESHTIDYLDQNSIFVNGNRTKDTYTLRPPSGASSPCYPGTCTATYTYDPRDRLVGNTDGHGNTTTYTLDGAGNILTETATGSPTKTYTYTGNQLQQITAGGTTAKYWYDDAGRLACTTTAAGTSADCAPPEHPAATLLAEYSYDYLDRLATYRAFTAGTQTDKAQYTHDALDRTVTQTEEHPSLAGGARTTTFDYLGLTNQQTQEKQTNSGGTLAVKDYSYDPAGRRLSMTNTPYSGGTAGSPTTYTYGYDPHGSASQLLDPGGNTKASYGYQPYGQPDTALTQGDTSTTTPFNPFRYTAKRYDTGSATIDMGARRFGPDTNRFLNQDLFHGATANLGLSTDPLTNNRYALAAGNPISYREWDGHAPTADNPVSANPELNVQLNNMGDTTSTRSANAAEFGQNPSDGSLLCRLVSACVNLDSSHIRVPPPTAPRPERTRDTPPPRVPQWCWLRNQPKPDYCVIDTDINVDPRDIARMLTPPTGKTPAFVTPGATQQPAPCSGALTEVGPALCLRSTSPSRKSPAFTPGPPTQFSTPGGSPVGGGVSFGLIFTRTGKVYAYAGTAVGSPGASVSLRAGYITSPHTAGDIETFASGGSDTWSATGHGLSYGTTLSSGRTSVEVGIGSGEGATFAPTYATLYYDYDRYLW